MDAGAIAAAYGSVSAVTFVTGASYLETQQLTLHGHMVAIMALMESPAIIIGLLLISMYNKDASTQIDQKSVIKHSLTNGSVLLILGSLIIGYIANAKQAEGIKPFTNDLFKGFLAIFLLDMGMVAASRFKAFKKQGSFLLLFALLVPLFNGVCVAFISQFITDNVGNRLIFSILAASASYIAVPAAMRLVAPKADPGIYIPMALGVTFPLNVTIGLPLYMQIIHG